MNVDGQIVIGSDLTISNNSISNSTGDLTISSNGNLNVDNIIISQLADAVNPQDAINKRFLQSELDNLTEEHEFQKMTTESYQYLLKRMGADLISS